MPLSRLKERLLGTENFLKHSDLKEMTRRNPFSAYLNYIAYDSDLEMYLNQDETYGFLWECSPAIFAGKKTLTALEGVFRAGLPHNAVVQFIFHADSHIDPILRLYKENRTKHSEMIDESVDSTVQFLSDGRRGLSACADIPVRNFRLFVAVKIPKDAQGMPKLDELSNPSKTNILTDIKRQLAETFKAAMIHPVIMQPESLLEWSRRLFNSYPDGYPEDNIGTWYDSVPLRKQIINSNTTIKEESDYIKIDNNYFCCTTPKAIATDIDPLKTNSLFGGIWGVISDADQIKTDFLYTFNIFFEKGLEVKLHAKCNIILNQQAVGSLSPSLRRKQSEFLAAADDLERGVKYAKIVPIMWVWSDDVEVARDSCARVQRIWENNGYVMQRETMITKILFLSSLPFGLYTTGNNIENLERDFVSSVSAIAPLIPVQSDFSGLGSNPKLIFTGRKGQLVSLDFFDRGANNHNVLCCAASGSGKSFQVNFIAFNYYSCGALIRIIDIGGSYKKIASMVGGKYLDFDPQTNICLNPFSYIQEPVEELKSVTAVFAQMAYSNSDREQCSNTELNLIRNAVRWAWEQKGQQADSDTVYEFLLKFPDVENANMEEMGDNPELISIARKLAFNIREFTSNGFHGRFFVGPSTFDIRRDEFVVLELENLRVQPDLYRVVTLLIINSVTQDLYLSDRSRPRLVIFDEAWQFLDKGSMFAPVINEGYRRARKYHGSFMIITQSLLDLKAFGEVGDVIKSNSAFKILLASDDFEQAKSFGLIDYDSFTMQLLKSVRSNPPKYSELFFDTPFSVGVARLVVNPYAYFIYTSHPKEIAMIEGMVKDGMSYHEAIEQMVIYRKNGEI